MGLAHELQRGEVVDRPVTSKPDVVAFEAIDRVNGYGVLGAETLLRHALGVKFGEAAQ